MGRANRRKKIRNIMRRAREKRLAEQRLIEDPETCVGQARCSVERLKQFEVTRCVAREMSAEEVLVDLPAQTPPQSWFQWALSFVR